MLGFKLNLVSKSGYRALFLDRYQYLVNVLSRNGVDNHHCMYSLAIACIFLFCHWHIPAHFVCLCFAWRCYNKTRRIRPTVIFLFPFIICVWLLDSLHSVLLCQWFHHRASWWRSRLSLVIDCCGYLGPHLLTLISSTLWKIFIYGT